jgi:CheY-like chemotaxis protein
VVAAEQGGASSMRNDIDSAATPKWQRVSAGKGNPFPPASNIPWLLDALVVDDDPIDAWLALEALRADPRVNRATASNSPEDTLALLAEGSARPSLIFLDIRMPKIDGFRFLDILQHNPAAAHIPVVMLTTSAFERDVQIARTKNIRGYIVKSSTTEQLRERFSNIVTQALGEWKRQ